MTAFQSELRSTFSRHSMKPLEVMRWPLTVFVCSPWKFLRRISMGSMPSCSATSSSWHSKAKRGCTEPWPRFGPHGGLFVNTRVESNR